MVKRAGFITEVFPRIDALKVYIRMWVKVLLKEIFPDSKEHYVAG
jgi:hypothetical protein